MLVAGQVYEQHVDAGLHVVKELESALALGQKIGITSTAARAIAHLCLLPSTPSLTASSCARASERTQGRKIQRSTPLGRGLRRRRRFMT